MNDYRHESDLSPVKPFDSLQPTTRQFTGTPHVHRAYVLNRTTGKFVEACGHKHRTFMGAAKCSDRLLATVIKRRPS
jgi:hypothetical protein